MLSIDGMNLDSYLDTKKYTAQKSAEYGNSEYRDGWWKRHRDIVRYSIKATAVLSFPNATEFSAFLTHLNNNIGVEGDHSVTLYVNNTGATETISAYVEHTVKTAISTEAYGKQPVFFSVTLKMEER